MCSGEVIPVCLECEGANMIVDAISQQCVCTAGMFMAEDTSECVMCPELCATCTSADQCTSCKDAINYEIVDGQCQLRSCGSGFYRD